MSMTIISTIPGPVTSQNHYRPLSFLIIFSFLLFFGNENLLADHSAELIWTAPGDDYTIGQAYQYEIRYSSAPIGSDTTNWWNFAQRLSNPPYPSPAGFKDSCVIPNLPIDNHIYIAIRTTDEAFNWSEISNIAEIHPSLCIDMTKDGHVNILDALYLLNCLYNDGPAIPEGTIDDIDNSGEVNILDAIFIINYCLKDGPAPDCGE